MNLEDQQAYRQFTQDQVGHFGLIHRLDIHADGVVTLFVEVQVEKDALAQVIRYIASHPKLTSFNCEESEWDAEGNATAMDFFIYSRIHQDDGMLDSLGIVDETMRAYPNSLMTAFYEIQARLGISLSEAHALYIKWKALDRVGPV